MRVALVLGSGGARGWTHIGVIEEIERRGHEIVSVAGASMGSLVGGIYAAGKLPELHEWAASLTKSDVRGLLDITIGNPGLIKGTKVLEALEEITGPVNIEDLQVPYTAVAVDLLTHREVWFQDGPLYLAIRSSISIPTVFTPVRIGNYLLTDGGVLNPVPVEPTLAVTSDATIAVDLFGPAKVPPAEVLKKSLEKEDSLLSRAIDAAQGSIESLQKTAFGLFFNDAEDEEEEKPITMEDVLPQLRRSTAEESTPVPTEVKAPSISEIQDSKDAEKKMRLPDSLGMMQVADMALKSMQEIIGRYRAAANPVTATVVFPRDLVGDLDYHRAAELIELGRTEAVKVLDAAGL